MRGALPEIERRGAELAIIGNGSPAQAGFFAADQDLTGRVFTDPARAVYRALGMRDGLRSTFNPRVLANAARAWSKGFRQKRTQGDPLQQGGVLLVDGSGNIVFSHLSQVAGDHPSLEVLLRALDKLAGA